LVRERAEELVRLAEELTPGELTGEMAGDLARVRQAARMVRDEAIRLDGNLDSRQIRHDLRNPLGALIGYADLLTEDGVDLTAIRSAALELLAVLEKL